MLLSGGHYVLLSDVEFVLLSVRMLYNIVGAQLVLLSAPHYVLLSGGLDLVSETTQTYEWD